MKITIDTETPAKYFIKNLTSYITGYEYENNECFGEIKSFMRDSKYTDIQNKIIIQNINGEKYPAIPVKTNGYVMVGDNATKERDVKTMAVTREAMNSVAIEFIDLELNEMIELDTRIREYCKKVGIKILDIRIARG